MQITAINCRFVDRKGKQSRAASAGIATMYQASKYIRCLWDREWTSGAGSFLQRSTQWDQDSYFSEITFTVNKLTKELFYYRQQRNCGKVVFLRVSVILSRGVWQAATPGRQTHRADTPPSSTDGHCSRRYASYWNAFLFLLVICKYSLHTQFILYSTLLRRQYLLGEISWCQRMFCCIWQTIYQCRF